MIVRNFSPQRSCTLPASCGEHTTPSSPAFFAFSAYCITTSSIGRLMRMSRSIVSWSVEVSCVTAMSNGRVPSGRVSPSSAPFIIGVAPAACTLVISTSRLASTDIAFLTVFGISCSFRSRKILCPRALISFTIDGPSA